MHSTIAGAEPMTWWLPLGAAPAYSELPWAARAARMISLTVQADAARLAPLVPEPLIAADDGRAHLWMLDMGSHSGAGSYMECLLAVPSTFEGAAGFYPLWSYVDSDVSLMLGREITGVPKKIAQLRLERADDQLLFSVMRGGVELVRGGLVLQAELTSEQVGRLNSRMSGSVWALMEAYTPAQPDLAPQRLVLEERGDRTIHRAVRGQGFVTCTGSAADPLQQVGDLRVLRATYMEYSTVLHAPLGRGVFAVSDRRLFARER
jgi:acetoacetate decarboxylase